MKEREGSLARGAGVIVGVFAGFLLGGMVFVAGTALAQHRASNAANNAVRTRAGGQMGGQSAASGPSDAEHASLAKLAGEYDRVIKFVGQTGANAAPSSGTSKFSVVLGGRFILEESHDTVFGRPVDGLRIYGYNDATKEYEMARMYTMSNGITMLKGASSDGGKTIDFGGEAGTPSGTGKMPLHALFVQTDDDHFSVTMATVGADGKEMPFQETDYTRKK
ncbi:MAG: DUF1579 family protein [Candidatus Acidiferrales bacterium]